MTQREAVLHYMKKHGSITQREATYNLYVSRLSACIFDLKRAGYPIEAKRETVNTPYGKTQIARYFLSE